jgi:nucleoside 2-deoxyribosyltransferase
MDDRCPYMFIDDEDGVVESPFKTFLIAPVRSVDLDTFSAVVSELKKKGWGVYWPAHDTDQNDPTGYRICQDNLAAIEAADAVHVIWDGKSQGCLFDLGMAFALGKPVFPIQLPEPTEGKSFQNMIMEWATK